MKFSTLSEWLVWVNSIHFTDIDLGLTRITAVAKNLRLLPIQPYTIVVGGTNGKGSTVATLEVIYRCGGYRVACFTSPILFKHNELVRINGEMPNDHDFCRAYEKIEAARGSHSLTAFEYHTLAALLLFQEQPLDLIILEVGMGGRLDAVNIVDSDIAIVTSIALDHTQWLGKTREAIGFEKAGIFRPNKPAICGDKPPPDSLLSTAKRIHAPLFQQGKDFWFKQQPDYWEWQSQQTAVNDLPYNSLLLQNMSTALMAIEQFQSQLPVTLQQMRDGLGNVFLPGRMQMVEHPIKQIFDVSHNPAAIHVLAERIKALSIKGKVLAVFSMLEDKDIEESIRAMSRLVDEWYIAPLSVARAASSEQLIAAMQKEGVNHLHISDSIEQAYQLAIASAGKDDLIVSFGSFHTVAATWQTFERFKS